MSTRLDCSCLKMESLMYGIAAHDKHRKFNITIEDKGEGILKHTMQVPGTQLQRIGNWYDAEYENEVNKWEYSQRWDGTAEAAAKFLRIALRSNQTFPDVTINGEKLEKVDRLEGIVGIKVVNRKTMVGFRVFDDPDEAAAFHHRNVIYSDGASRGSYDLYRDINSRVFHTDRVPTMNELEVMLDSTIIQPVILLGTNLPKKQEDMKFDYYGGTTHNIYKFSALEPMTGQIFSGIEGLCSKILDGGRKIYSISSSLGDSYSDPKEMVMARSRVVEDTVSKEFKLVQPAYGGDRIVLALNPVNLLPQVINSDTLGIIVKNLTHVGITPVAHKSRYSHFNLTSVAIETTDGEVHEYPVPYAALLREHLPTNCSDGRVRSITCTVSLGTDKVTMYNIPVPYLVWLRKDTGVSSTSIPGILVSESCTESFEELTTICRKIVGQRPGAAGGVVDATVAAAMFGWESAFYEVLRERFTTELNEDDGEYYIEGVPIPTPKRDRRIDLGNGYEIEWRYIGENHIGVVEGSV